MNGIRSFRVEGVRRADRQPIDCVIEAETAAAAITIAEARGIEASVVSEMVGHARRSPSGHTSGSVEPLRDGVRCESGSTTLPRPPLRRHRWIVTMQGIQAALLLVVVAILNRGGESPWIALGWASVWAVVMSAVQWCLLMPVSKPAVKPGRTVKWWLWASALAAGLCCGVLVFGAVIISGDFGWGLGLWGHEAENSFATVGLVCFFVSWVVCTPLLIAFFKRRDRDKRYCQVAASLFLGSVIEVLAAIPIDMMYKKRETCQCGPSASIAGAFLAMMVGFLVLGPAIVLAVFWRRSRAGSRGLCAACGFDLTGLASRDRCPECGAGWKVTSARSGVVTPRS